MYSRLVEIPIRSLRGDTVYSVEHGEVIGFVKDLIRVRWEDGMIVPYFPDQIGPMGTFRRGQRWPAPVVAIEDEVNHEAA